MRLHALPFLLVASLGVAAPAVAQNDLRDIVTGVARSLVAQEADKAAYLEAQRLNTISAYRNYLTQYPKGAYRANAERALATLGVAAAPTNPVPVAAANMSAAATEADIGLTRTQRVQLQRQLTALGYATGVADGLWGANTRSAIANWQSANKLPATRYLTASQVRLIGQQAGPGVVADTGNSASDDDRIEERLLSLTSTERRDIQRRLTMLGYNTRGVDGVFGRNTRLAIAAWQRDEGLRASGYITADQLRELRRQTS
ncbi:MAG: peptidoglycan-binding domain-containing protein [Paracoccaceae bacterium]